MRASRGDLLRFATDIFAATGMNASDAATVAEVLVWANERGIDSHGVVRMPTYLAGIRNGTYRRARRDGFDELLLSGERRDREAGLRRRMGISLPARLWNELGALAQGLGVSPPDHS